MKIKPIICKEGSPRSNCFYLILNKNELEFFNIIKNSGIDPVLYLQRLLNSSVYGR